MAAKHSNTARAGTLILAILVVAIATSAFVSAPPPGKVAYESACASCHDAGAHGAPRAGHAQEWRARAARGRDNLYEAALRGKVVGDRIMPPRGGNARLSDEEVKRAVDYIVERAEGP